MAEELTLREAAERFDISGRTLRYAAAQGHLQARRLGNQWVTSVAAVGEWIAHGKHAPGRPSTRASASGPSSRHQEDRKEAAAALRMTGRRLG
jgi:excisionase family DNA binding protein